MHIWPHLRPYLGTGQSCMARLLVEVLCLMIMLIGCWAVKFLTFLMLHIGSFLCSWKLSLRSVQSQRKSMTSSSWFLSEFVVMILSFVGKFEVLPFSSLSGSALRISYQNCIPKPVSQGVNLLPEGIILSLFLIVWNAQQKISAYYGVLSLIHWWKNFDVYWFAVFMLHLLTPQHLLHCLFSRR